MRTITRIYRTGKPRMSTVELDCGHKSEHATANIKTWQWFIGKGGMTCLKCDQICNRPLAGGGLTSYRCKGPFGWIMIGARDAVDAMNEARRSNESVRLEDLQVWDGQAYVAVPPKEPT